MKQAIAIALVAAGAVVLVRGRYDLRLANRADALLGRKSIRSSQRSKLRGNSIKREMLKLKRLLEMKAILVEIN